MERTTAEAIKQSRPDFSDVHEENIASSCPENWKFSFDFRPEGKRGAYIMQRKEGGHTYA